MHQLTDTTHSMTMVTGSAVSTDYVCDYADHTSTAFTPGSSQGNVSTATTTTIVAAPGASTQRQVKLVKIANRHASSSQTVQVFKVVSGSSYAVTDNITLAAGQTLLVSPNGWTIRSTVTQVVVATGKVFTVNNSITFSGTDGTVITLPATSATMARTDAGNTFSGNQLFNNVVNIGSTGASTSFSKEAGKLIGTADGLYTTTIYNNSDSHSLELVSGSSSGYVSGISVHARAATAYADSIRLWIRSANVATLNNTGWSMTGTFACTNTTDASSLTTGSIHTDGGFSCSKKAYVGDDLVLDTAGKGIRIKEGANARMGVSTLVGGTVTVSNTTVTANTRISLTIQSLGTVTVPKAIGVTAKVASTSFTITSADNTDTSVIFWELKEPA